MNSIKEILTEDQQKQFKPTPMLLKPGEAAFHHPLEVHGSFSNPSEYPRRAAVINVFEDGTFSNSDESLLEGVDVIPKGHKMDGQFFPLLFNKKWIE